MPIPLRVPRIHVPPEDPFRNDLLDRKKSAESFTSIVASLEGPAVVAIDAVWGMGKTTFLEMWTQHLRNEGLTVVDFNAWETDFAAHPFLALAAELDVGLKRSLGESAEPQLIDKLASNAKKLLKPALLAAVSQAVPGVGIAADVVKTLLDDATESNFSEYVSQKKAVTDFRSALHEIAQEVTKTSKDRPLVVVIDELDRCRPTYAIALLEAAKHVFSVRHVVFVLAINREQLAHSIRSQYGSGFDAEIYLRRFIDVSVRLPDPRRDRLLETTLDAIGIKKFVSKAKDKSARQEFSDARQVLLEALALPTLDVRSVLHSLHTLGFILESIRADQRALLYATAVTTILRVYDERVYRRLVDGYAQDEEVIDAVRKHYGREKWNKARWTVFFEAMVMSLIQGQTVRRGEPIDARTPQYSAYMQLVEKEEEAEEEDKQNLRERDVIQTHRWFMGISGKSMPWFEEFRFASERMDLFSDSFIRDAKPKQQ